MNALEQAAKLAEIASIKDRGVPHKLAVGRLEELLTDESAEVRAEAADATWGYPHEGALLRATLELARGDDAPAVRLKALGALGTLIREGDLLGVETPDFDTDSESFDKDLHAEVRAHLLSLLGADGEDERRVALQSLAFVSSASGVAEAIEELGGSEDVAARVVAIRCMGRSGDPRWATAIGEAIEENDGGLVMAGIEAAGLAEVVTLVPLLARILRGSREPLTRRIRAAAALSRLGGKNTAGVLLEIAEDSGGEDGLREAANEALNALTILSGGVTT